MRSEFLLYAPPLIGQEEIDEVVDTLRSGWLTTGPKTRKFEQQFTAQAGAPASLALNSCTAGLHTALVTLGVGDGDEVITTSLTFAASVNVIEHVGARPVLVDVEPDTLNLDPQQVEQAITSRTKAILPVHYAGHPVDLDAIDSLATDHGLVVLEDAAHAIGAKYRGRTIGSRGNPTAFSFYATKNITTGEGGMLTGESAFIDEARIVSLHGMSREAWRRYEKGGSWHYDIIQPGFKYNMSDLQASLGLCQLRRLDAFQQRRGEIAAAYQKSFAEIPELELPVTRPEVQHAWHLYVLRIRNRSLSVDRDGLIAALRDRNIGTSVHFIPIHLHPFYRQKYGFRPDDFPVAWDSFQRMVSLPLNPGMSDEDVSDVIDAVHDVIRGGRWGRRAA